MDPKNEQGWYWAGEESSWREIDAWHERKKTRRRQRQHDSTPEEKLPYQIVLQGAPINLSEIEYRIVTFLATRPYHAFAPEQIVDHVNQATELLQIDELQQHVISLRSKLGFFRDYVQSVPYIGYRFKP